MTITSSLKSSLKGAFSNNLKFPQPRAMVLSLIYIQSQKKKIISLTLTIDTP